MNLTVEERQAGDNDDWKIIDEGDILPLVDATKQYLALINSLKIR